MKAIGIELINLNAKFDASIQVENPDKLVGICYIVILETILLGLSMRQGILFKHAREALQFMAHFP